MESAKHWELPGEELGTGTRRRENHLNGGIDCISSFVPHRNWGSKSTKFDDLLREKRRLESLEVLFLWGAKSLPDSLLFEGKAPVAKQGAESSSLLLIFEEFIPKKGSYFICCKVYRNRANGIWIL
ncbi:hypothetical protein BUALT_Bualt06G0062500 [Buddleja alternifolia]|uniref:Uncharacterized protein n=1 Tax=Buddleja alternifolia TaxID=168488 RepID=A0AAV6XD64_9LAMI|nr:hypothetical protein BUALT_Bualt06G0062500 [Buddleja alternifolia]